MTLSDEDKSMFRKSIGKVRRINSNNTIAPRPSKRTAVIRTKDKTETDPQDRLSDALQDITTGYGDQLNFSRQGVQNRVLQKLRRGQLPCNWELDLHGLTVREAKKELLHFLDHCQINQLRNIRIIHGKGHGSRDRQPIIKRSVANWLVQCEEVLAFCSAREQDGGTGALYVLLRAQ